jgi:hypothetical protein
MENERQNKFQRTTGIGAMQKRRETMADGRRYIIYYTFGENLETAENGGENSPAAESETSEGRREENV